MHELHEEDQKYEISDIGIPQYTLMAGKKNI